MRPRCRRAGQEGSRGEEGPVRRSSREEGPGPAKKAPVAKKVVRRAPAKKAVKRAR